MPETHIPQGELVVGVVVHGTALNCMVVPYTSPENWCFKQFTSDDQLERFALEHKLIIRRSKDESNNCT